MYSKKRLHSEITGRKTAAPYVSIDGVKFFSDRFYLSAPTGLAGYKKTLENSKNDRNSCSCQDPPPLLDIVKLVNSLDLEAVIIATYSIDLKWMQTALPKLFSNLRTNNSTNNIPTLVLHGSKRLNEARKRMIQTERGKAISEADKDSDQSILYMKRLYQEKIYNEERKDGNTNNIADVIEILDSSDDESGMKSVWDECISVLPNVLNTDMNIVDNNITHDDICSLSERLYMTQILSAYVPVASSIRSMIPKPKKSSKKEIIVIDSSDDESGIDSTSYMSDTIGISDEIISNRKLVNGVHHPKYYLLFEKRGSLVVVISTANLTSPKSVDGIWVQRFERRGEMDKELSIDEVSAKYDGSDFGFVLTDLLLRQSEAAEASCMIPEQFLKKYLSVFHSLNDLPKMYRFDKSQVHLITTVPGFYSEEFAKGHLSNCPHNALGYKVHYGPQRVADILNKLSEKPSSSTVEQADRPRPWLPQHLLSERDKLIIQTTSIGSKWSSLDLEDLISQYMGGRLTDDPLQVADIVWPSMEYATRTVVEYSKCCPERTDSLSNFCFFSSTSFNESDLSFLQRLKRYENSTPAMLTTPLLPHIKSFARLLDDQNFVNDHLAWFMLTSACLSRGAQGFSEKLKSKEFEEERRGYSNFEVGVLFVSRMCGDRHDRQYTCFPSNCECKKLREDVQEFKIPLPIPYNIRPPPFQDVSDAEDFCETPFFHQITKNTMVSGKCLLTPYGKFLSENESK